jgi:hypothetical protein
MPQIVEWLAASSDRYCLIVHGGCYSVCEIATQTVSTDLFFFISDCLGV